MFAVFLVDVVGGNKGDFLPGTLPIFEDLLPHPQETFVFRQVEKSK